MRLFLQEQTVK